MNRNSVIAAALSLTWSALAQGGPPAPAASAAPTPSPGEIVAAAPAGEWRAIPAGDLLVMDLAPDAKGKARRVVIQLIPAPFSQGWVANIRRLAAAHWWDGTSINRVQDNYVVQWGDANGEDKARAKALPPGLATVPQSAYDTRLPADLKNRWENNAMSNLRRAMATDQTSQTAVSAVPRDAYAIWTSLSAGWPVASDLRGAMWPVHCYGMVGVGRNLSPDTGSGAELYTVIGTPPRHLDHNIALVGRVIEGIDLLSSLPRGTGALGFYETTGERVPIVSVRLGNEVAGLPAYQYLSTESETFGRYADARANRRDPFFIHPAGGADVCNIPVPVRRVPPAG